jgi:hypothetical protein
MWYRLLNNKDKDNPSYEVKLIAAEADKLIRKNLFLKTKYNPTDLEVDRAITRLFDHLIEKYDSIENVRNHSKGFSLFSLLEKNVEELFGTK